MNKVSINQRTKISCNLISYLKEAHVQPLENLGVVELGVGGAHGRLQDAGEVVLVQRGGGSHQLGPAERNTHSVSPKESMGRTLGGGGTEEGGAADLSRSMRWRMKSPWPSSR